MSRVELNFDVIKEDWCYYSLKDGAILKVKIILVRLFNDGVDSKGIPTMGFLATNVMGVIPYGEMISNKALSADDDVGFEVKTEIWNEYQADDGTTITIKPVIAQVMRTATLDPNGEPVYTASIQPLIKINKTLVIQK